jgi:hypothetical protein
MIRALYRLLRHLGDAQVIARGPAAHARRFARRRAHRELSRAMRRGGLLISGRSRRSKVLVRPPRAPLAAMLRDDPLRQVELLTLAAAAAHIGRVAPSV